MKNGGYGQSSELSMRSTGTPNDELRIEIPSLNSGVISPDEDLPAVSTSRFNSGRSFSVSVRNVALDILNAFSNHSS